MNDDMGVIYKDEYPETLRNMKSPPRKLFLRGRFPAPGNQKYLCVVGSRSWSVYGRDSVRRIIGGLAGYPITIVSGLAVGIDSIAHLAALEAGLHCVAFPGSSLDWDEIYPANHIYLARRIVEKGGALLSEWQPGYPTAKWAFPSRNRLMAGLSHATLIIEAGRRSGSLMTAKHAEDLHRDVFAVPGHIHAPQSYGTHMLIQRGAALITGSRDVLLELGFRVPKAGLGGRIDVPAAVAQDGLAVSILKLLSLEDSNTEIIFEKTGVSAQVLNETLSLLELEGLITVEGSAISLVRDTR